MKPIHEIIIPMNITEIIVHRGNSPVNTTEPLEQVSYYVNAGFKKIEIDIYAISETRYKFCHPLDREGVNEVYDIHDGFLENLIKQLPEVEWYVDLKCLDLEGVPLELLHYLTDVFGKNSIIIAAQHEILEFAHKVGRKTAQYFKDSLNDNLDYSPDLFIQNDSDTKTYQKENTIIHCPDSKAALSYLTEGYAGVMVDGNKLISN